MDDDLHGSHDRLTEEARATASALLEWLGSRVDRAAAAGGPGARPAQSPGPCTWCPVCAVVAALRGEQPELTARMAEEASAIMTLLRVMVRSHTGSQGPAHPAHDPAAHSSDGASAAPSPWPPGAWASDPWVTDPWDSSWPPADATPSGWPREWGPTGAPEPVTPEPVAPEPVVAGPVDAEPWTAGPTADSPTARPATDAPHVDPPDVDPGHPRRTPRPGPRRAPARTTSPREASPRPSAVRTPRPAPRRESTPAAPGSDTPSAGEPTATGAQPTGGRVQRIAIRRAADPGS